jgi:hypothetical protein
VKQGDVVIVQRGRGPFARHLYPIELRMQIPELVYYICINKPGFVSSSSPRFDLVQPKEEVSKQ